MKKYLMILLAAILCSCNNNNYEQTETLIDVTPTSLAGVWMLESYDNGKTLAEGNFVYIEFVRSNRSYTLYQNVGSMYTQTMSGNYFIETDPNYGAIIRGNYGASDHNYFDWSHRYIVSMTADRMRWQAKDDAENVSVYVRVESLPEL